MGKPFESVAHTIEDTRLVLLQGEVPSLTAMSFQWITALIFCEASYKALREWNWALVTNYEKAGNEQ